MSSTNKSILEGSSPIRAISQGTGPAEASDYMMTSSASRSKETDGIVLCSQYCL